MTVYRCNSLSIVASHPNVAKPYGITADELHERIIDDLKAHCKHMQLPPEMFDRIFTDNDGEQGRPIEQTIRLVVNAFAYGDIDQTVNP